MDLRAEERQSDSPFVDRIWRNHIEQGVPFISMANPSWSMVVTKIAGRTILTVRGPETHPSTAFAPPNAEFFGIQFKLGTLMPQFTPKMVMDRQDVNLPEAGGQKFWLNGAAWQFPDYENADTFVDCLVREGLLLQEPTVGAMLKSQPASEVSLRTVQRRFLQATGLTQGTVFQIERARFATALLKQGVSILDTVELAGYADQPHLTRSLKRYIGQTPAQIISESRDKGLSFLFESDPY